MYILTIINIISQLRLLKLKIKNSSTDIYPGLFTRNRLFYRIRNCKKGNVGGEKKNKRKTQLGEMRKTGG